MIKIISEGIFSSIADSLGFGALWGVLKSRFWQMIRGWTAVFDIWKADSKKQIDEAMTDYRTDIEKIKTRYRSAEAEFEKSNKLFGSSFGDHMLFMNPALAMGMAITEPLMNQEYRADTRRLLNDTGIASWGVTPSFVSNWIEDEPFEETPGGRAITYGPDGQVKKTDIILYEPKEAKETGQNEKMQSIMGVFVESKQTTQVISEQTSPFSKADAKKLADKIKGAFESEGVFNSFMEVGKKIFEQKQALVSTVVEPAQATINAISSMMSAETPEEFTNYMQTVSQSNPSLKSLDPGAFISEIDNATSSVLNNAVQLQKLLDEVGASEISEQELRTIIFDMTRNNFSNGIIETLENVYEETITALMEGITQEGLKKAKETEIGKQYANLIETNIQKLENAIKSLDKLEKAGESK